MKAEGNAAHMIAIHRRRDIGRCASRRSGRHLQPRALCHAKPRRSARTPRSALLDSADRSDEAERMRERAVAEGRVVRTGRDSYSNRQKSFGPATEPLPPPGRLTPSAFCLLAFCLLPSRGHPVLKAPQIAGAGRRKNLVISGRKVALWAS